MVAPARHIMRLHAGALLLAGAGAALAGSLDAALALQSDKVVRGASQSGGDPVLALDAGWRGDSGAALVAGLSTLGRDRRRGDAELLTGAGWGGVIDEDRSWRVGATRYDTLGRGPNRRPGYGEVSASLAWRDSLQGLVSYAPAYPGALPSGDSGRGRARFIEITGHQALSGGWSLDAGLGHAAYRDLAFADYRYGHLSLAWRHQGLQLVATRTFSSSASPNVAGPRAVLGLLLSW